MRWCILGKNVENRSCIKFVDYSIHTCVHRYLGHGGPRCLPTRLFDIYVITLKLEIMLLFENRPICIKLTVSKLHEFVIFKNPRDI